jgi:mRNA interferase YafQ
MRRITQRKWFRKDLKRVILRGKDERKLFIVVEQLARIGSLPAEFRPHRLVGRWSDFSECHIESDWLLIYDVNDAEVFLVRTGTHADLFE